MSALAALLEENRALRAAQAEDPALAAPLARLKAWQSARLARTYADLAADERYQGAVAFFLGELYGGADAAPRDRDLARAARALERLLPAPALGVLEQAIALEIRTQQLDAALARALGGTDPITAAAYAAAYPSAAPRAERTAQLAAIVAIGTALNRLVRHASLAVLLRLARRPAHAAGLGALQDFLERGFAAFRATGGAEEFLTIIGAREAELIERLYAGTPDPFPGVGTMTSVDHIIVGAGSAGCVLANRLSADPARRVLLLEAGGPDSSPFIHMPAGIARLVGNRAINWNYTTEPEPGLDGRRLWWPRGRVLGGSSSINAMCYTRGQPEDYDGWQEAGCPGWGYAEVLPYFRRAEDQARGADAYHGTGGPLSVSDHRYRSPLSQVFLDAARERGHPYNPDFNGATQAGVGWYQVTQRNGRRCSAAVAYLRPALVRPNLRVVTRALVTRLLIEGGRVHGVEYRHGGRTLEVTAGAVTLAGGAINSPQLLLLSGVGPAADLEALGIRVRLDLPGVGANLQDHLDYCTLVKSPSRATYDYSALGEAWVGLRYLLTGGGPGSSNVAEAGGFLCTARAGGSRPDVQLHFVPAQLDDHGRHRLPGHGYTFHVCVLRPESRGRIRLASADPAAAPRIAPNYLADPADAATLVAGVRLVRDIAAAAAFAPYRGAELYPGEAARSDAELLAAIRAKAETIYHPVGTCRMGTDPLAVVDPQLAVHGIGGLAVVDASVMPRLVSGNTNAPTIMIAEKAAAALAA